MKEFLTGLAVGLAVAVATAVATRAAAASRRTEHYDRGWVDGRLGRPPASERLSERL